MMLGLREANQQFARLIRTVRAGHEVVLTERGRPLAVIRRMTGGDDSTRLAALAADGLVQLATRPDPMPRPRWRPEALSGEQVAHTVTCDRDETA